MPVKGKAAERRPQAAKAVAKRPKQESLPTMTDRQFEDLDEKAIEYAGVRDQRMALTKQETTLQAELLTLMKRHKKIDYVYEDVEIHVVTEEEKVKVKIHKAKEEEEAA